jgi:hypothetical protein
MKIIGRKGQMFLLGAVVIVGILVILKYNISYPNALEEKKTLEGRLENDLFNNIVEELNGTLIFSYEEPMNITYNVFDFANFTRLKVSEHSMALKFLFVGSIANSTTDTLNVSLINMIGYTIDASLTLDGQSDAEQEIHDYEMWESGFTITPGSQYVLQIGYNGGVENITINSKSNKDVYVGFFDISLESEDSTHAARYQKDMNLR